MATVSEKIQEIAKEKGIKIYEEKAQVKAPPFGETEITVFLPEKKDAETLFKALYSADALRGLALSKIKTNQQDEARRAFTEKFQKAFKGADSATQKKALELLGIA
jgi:hypothetical protein